MATRSQDSLNAHRRATGSPGHHLSPTHGPAVLSTWLRTHHARLCPPTRRQPYWQVRSRRDDRYLAAGRTPSTAITNAIRADSLQPPPQNPEQYPGGLTAMVLVHSKTPPE